MKFKIEYSTCQALLFCESYFDFHMYLYADLFLNCMAIFNITRMFPLTAYALKNQKDDTVK